MAAIRELEMVEIIFPADGSWRMSEDYRELNRVAPPICAAVPNIVL